MLVTRTLIAWHRFLVELAALDPGLAFDLRSDPPLYITKILRQGSQAYGSGTAPIPHGALIAQLRNLLDSLHPFDPRHVAFCGLCGAMDGAQRLVGDGR